MLAEARALSMADYRSTHRRQLLDVSGSGNPVRNDLLEWPLGRFGGILVPTSRKLSEDLPGLALAVELAVSHQCKLVVICSQQAETCDFPTRFAAELGDQLILVDISDVHSDWLPPLNSTVNPLSKLERYNDVGSKRNVGLSLAIFLGWQYVLFMDDDIAVAPGSATLESGHLSHAIAVMHRDPALLAVGWTLEDFDDNSVVGHARSFLGMSQDIFIGAGALLVRCKARLPFFPDVYNEDWLFLIALAATAPDPGRALGWCGRVRQQRYDPFRVRRAKSEEVGEIIGEGLMNLLEDHGPACVDRAMAPRYWRRALSKRAQLLEAIRASAKIRFDSSGHASEVEAHQRVMDSMTAALTIVRLLRPMDLVNYVRVWQNDEKIWQSHLLNLALAPNRPFSMMPLSIALAESPANQIPSGSNRSAAQSLVLLSSATRELATA